MTCANSLDPDEVPQNARPCLGSKLYLALRLYISKVFIGKSCLFEEKKVAKKRL